MRSLLGLGYRFGNGSALSLAVSHKSNASTSNFNPGANSIFLRWHWGDVGRFGGARD
ncbi:acyloxyacyl hydrolase [Jhaorihella thermophila]